VQSAVRNIGPAARIVGANRVRKGGLGGFFAREHVEVEVEVPAGSPSGTGGPGGQREAGAKDSEQAERPARAKQDERAERAKRGAAPKRGTARADARRAAPAERYGDEPEGAGKADPMAELIEEMASSGPSSVLDLAERVNNKQSRYGLEDNDDSLGAHAGGAVAATAGEGFAAVLARIAQDAGLVAGDDERPGPRPSLTTARQAEHTGAILSELDSTREVVPAVGGQRSPVTEEASTMTTRHRAEDRLPGPGTTLPAPQRQIGEIGIALHELGLPLPACQSVMPAADRQSLQREVADAMRAFLPDLPPTPHSPSSVVAVVGPRGQVMATARALAVQMGGSGEDVALATTRKVWRQNEHVIASPEIAVEQRRSWRWREQPSVVAVESEVRPSGASWANQVLRALGPTLCWGVASASHKPEDLAAWSQSLGGLDLIALVDLESTTTPAAALAGPVPVGRLDDEPATPEQWAKVLCERLLG